MKNIYALIAFILTTAPLFASGKDEQASVYHSLMRALLTESISSQVTIKDDHLEIESDQPEEAASLLNSAFSGTAKLYKRLGLTVSGASVESEEENLGFNINNVTEAVAHVRKIFGNDFFDSMKKLIGINFDDIYSEADGAELKDGQLFSKKIPGEYSNIHEGLIHCLTALWAERPISELQKAWNHGGVYGANLKQCQAGEKAARKKVWRIGKPSKSKGPLVTRVGMVEWSDGTVQTYIDLKGLYFDLFPPLVRHSDKKTVSLHIGHMNNWMTQLTGNGILLQPFNVDGEDYVRPLAFTKTINVTRPTMHYLVIDRSRSLFHYYDKLIGHIKDFLDKLREVDGSAQVKLVFFADEIQNDGPIDIAAKVQLEKRLDQSKENLGNETMLFAALRDVIGDAGQLINDHNVNIACFTDGQNNCEPRTLDPVKEKINDIDKRLLPKFFTLGFGEQVEKELVEVSTTFKGPYIKLHKISDFQLILEHLEEIKYKREILEFFYTIGQQKEVKVTLPVLQNGNVQPVSLILPMTNDRLKLRINGQEMTATRNKNIKKATTVDRIWLLSGAASEKALEDGTPPSNKIKKLNKILNHLNDLTVTREQDFDLRGIIKTRIGQDICDLETLESEIALARIKHRNAIY